MTTSGAINGRSPVLLAADPTTNLGAATKQYVDNNILAPWRNQLVNGNFDFWQRIAPGGSVSSVNGGGQTFCADRWAVLANNSSAVVSQQAFALGQTAVPNNPKYFQRVAVTSVAATGNYLINAQNIENLTLTSGQQCMLTFWAKGSVARSIGVEFIQLFGTGGSPSSAVFGIGVANVPITTSWAKYTVPVTMTSVSGKTLGTNGDDSAAVYFWLDAGASFNSRSGSIGQASWTVDIAQAQFEINDNATAFELRPPEVELALCQRYFEKSYEATTVPGTVTGIGSEVLYMTGLASLAHVGYLQSVYKVPKRAVPTTVVYYSPTSGAAAKVRDVTNNADIAAGVVNTQSSSRVQYTQYTMSAAQTTVNIQAHWTASADL